MLSSHGRTVVDSTCELSSILRSRVRTTVDPELSRANSRQFARENFEPRPQRGQRARLCGRSAAGAALRRLATKSDCGLRCPSRNRERLRATLPQPQTGAREGGDSREGGSGRGSANSEGATPLHAKRTRPPGGGAVGRTRGRSRLRWRRKTPKGSELPGRVCEERLLLRRRLLLGALLRGLLRLLDRLGLGRLASRLASHG